MIELHNGNCLDVLRGMAENSIDTVITDPPAGIAFMGKKGVACIHEGRSFIGIELNAEYVAIARARIANAIDERGETADIVIDGKRETVTPVQPKLL